MASWFTRMAGNWTPCGRYDIPVARVKSEVLVALGYNVSGVKGGELTGVIYDAPSPIEDIVDAFPGIVPARESGFSGVIGGGRLAEKL